MMCCVADLKVCETNDFTDGDCNILSNTFCSKDQYSRPCTVIPR